MPINKLSCILNFRNWRKIERIIVRCYFKFEASTLQITSSNEDDTQYFSCNNNWDVDLRCAHTSWASYPLVIQLLQDITAKIKIWYICTL